MCLFVSLFGFDGMFAMKNLGVKWVMCVQDIEIRIHSVSFFL